MDKELKNRIKSTSMYRTLSNRYDEETAIAEIDLAVSNYIYDCHGGTVMRDPDEAINAMGLENDSEAYLMDTIMLAEYYASLEEVDYHAVTLDNKQKKLDDFDYDCLNLYAFTVTHNGSVYEVTSPKLNSVEQFENVDSLFEFMDWINQQLEVRWETPIYMKIEDNFYTFDLSQRELLKDFTDKFFTEFILKKLGQKEFQFGL